MKNFKKYIPNILTFFRFGISFCLPFIIFEKKFGLSLVCFIAAALTDFFDGFLARKWDCESRIGSIIDPISDKVMIFNSFVSLSMIGVVPYYVTIIVITRDIGILIISMILIKNSKITKISPILSSKINTMIQMIYIVIILFCKFYNISISFNIMSYIVILSTLYSSAEYAYQYIWNKNENISKK